MLKYSLIAGVGEITVFFKLLGVEKQERLKLLQNEGPQDIYYIPGSWISTVEWQKPPRNHQHSLSLKWTCAVQKTTETSFV